MAEKAASEERQSGSLRYLWAFVLGLAILFLIVIGITSDDSIHGILHKQSRSSEAIQGVVPPSGH